MQTSAEYTVYVGCYATAESQGIFVVKLDCATGAMRIAETIAGAANPSFLTIHPNGHWLYAVNEVEAINGQPGGVLSAYSVQHPAGSLHKLNSQSTMSEGPCYVSVDASGKYALVANYRGGGITVLPILRDGSLGRATDYVQHNGHSVHPTRQEKAHVHSVQMAPSGQGVFVADLGLDVVQIYRLDGETGRLHALDAIRTQPGAGPRHFTFSANGRFLYLCNELDSTVNVYKCDLPTGAAEMLASHTMLPAGFTATSWGADIHLHPNGRFLYATNRGHDSIVIYNVDPETGALGYIAHVATQGLWPRHFSFDATGKILLVANQKSNNVVSYMVDANTGLPEPTGFSLEIPVPVCVQISQTGCRN